MVGKWHLGDFSADPRHHPRRHGFDSFAGVPHSNGEFPYSYWENETKVDDDLDLRQQGVTATFTRKAIEFIDANRSRPFFLYVAQKNVHPLLPSPAFAGKSAGSLWRLRRTRRERQRDREARHARLRDDTDLLHERQRSVVRQGAGALRGRDKRSGRAARPHDRAVAGRIGWA
jgi:hypothetical protein